MSAAVYLAPGTSAQQLKSTPIVLVQVIALVTVVCGVSSTSTANIMGDKTAGEAMCFISLPKCIYTGRIGRIGRGVKSSQ